jgi:DNA-binding winged helix-turn-helix (wHTH) protein/Flp pilus assembly protein TadD
MYDADAKKILKEFLKAGIPQLHRASARHDNTEVPGILRVPIQPILKFGDFRFDPEARLLMHGTRCVELSPKAREVLAALVKSAGRVVSKDDLLDIVWPGAPVEEGNLAVHIFALRRALGEDASTAGYIETIPKRGYRFAALVSRVRGDGTPLCGIAGHYLEQQTVEGCRRAAGAYREWIAKEPGSVQARTGLANALLFRFVLGDLSRDEAAPAARAILSDAAEIDPRSANLQLTRSRLLCLFDWQWERAEEELQRAFENANDEETRAVVRAWRGFDLAGRGDFERGLAELRRACEASPLSTYIWRLLAGAHFLARDFAGCTAVSRQALELHPGCGLLHRGLARALTALGEYDQARRTFRRAGMLDAGPQAGLLAEIAYLDAIAGKRDRAAAFLSRRHPQSGGPHVSRVLIAEIHAALGNRDRALDYVEEACRTRDWAIAGLRQNSRLDPVRNTPRYRSALACVGI